MIRFFDILLSSIALFLLFPIFVAVCIILRLTGEGEILYFQERVGKDNKPFKVIKFATMIKNSPSTGSGNITIINDPRVLPVGRFLRSTKINELPQILNIIKGDMSLIGPRPLTEDAYEYYSTKGLELICSVKPGLSGIGSIIFRDEELILSKSEDAKLFHKRIIGPYKELVETWYIQNESLSKYFMLILLTVFVLIFPSTNIIWRIFSSLPKPEGEIKNYLLV